MKILIATGIYPPEIGGPAGYVRALVPALMLRGIDVRVVTYGDRRTQTDEGWPVIVVSRRFGKVVRYIRYLIATFFQALSCDVVYVQGGVSEGFPATIAAILAGKPTVMRVPGDYAWEMYMQSVAHGELLDDFVRYRHLGRIWVYEWMERFVASRAKRIIVPSEYMKHIVATWGVSPDKIQVIYSTVSPLPVVESRETLRKKFGLAWDERVILTAVRAVPWKGVETLISAMVNLSHAYRLVVAGDGPMLDDWKKTAQKRGVSDRVLFLGRVDRKTLTEWYAAADVFALASGYEGFPHVVAEAVSVGLPCFVSDKGGNPETQALFPDCVQVFPYKDDVAWTQAFCDIPERFVPKQNPELTFEAMCEKVMDVLQTYAKTV